MRRLQVFIRPFTIALGWILLLGFVAVFVAERTGRLTVFANRKLEDLLAPHGERVQIGRLRVDWLQPAILLEDLEIGEGGRDLRIEEIEIVPNVLGGWIERIALREGRMTLTRDMHVRLRNVLESGGEIGSSQGVRSRGRTPSVYLDDIDVDLSPTPGEVWPIGRFDLRFTSGGGPSVLSGRVEPASWWAGPKPGAVVLTGHEVEEGILEVRTLLRDLELNLEEVPAGVPLESLRPFQPRAKTSIEAWGRIALMGGGPPPIGRFELHLEDGEMIAPDVEDPVRNIALDLEADFLPRGDDFLFDLLAWSGRGLLRGSWKESDFEATLLAGTQARVENQVEAWLRVRNLTIHQEDEAEWLALTGGHPGVRFPVQQLAADGSADLLVGFRLPAGWRARDGVKNDLQNIVHVECTGEASVAYAGPLRDEELKYGFPLRISEVRGDFFSAFTPRRNKRALMGMVDLGGQGASGGTVDATGTISSVTQEERAAGFRYAAVDLHFVGKGLGVAEEFAEATRGLRGWIPEDQLWARYLPSGGTVDVDAQIVTGPHVPKGATRFAVDLDGPEIRWAPIPAPLRDVHGRVTSISDGRGRFGVRVRGRGDLRTAREDLDFSLRIEGGQALEERNASDSAESAPPPQAAQAVKIDVRKLSLRGDDLEILAGSQPAVGDALELFRPKGFADARATLIRAPGEEQSRLLVEVIPGKPVAVQPEIFQMTTSDLRGRLLVDAQLEPSPPRAPDEGRDESNGPEERETWSTSVRALPLVGSWGAGVPVALVGELSASDTGKRLRLFGAGIDASNRRLLGSLSAAIAEQRGAGGSSQIDINALTLDGRIDFQADLGLGPRDHLVVQPGTRGAFDLYLRGADLVSAEGFELAGLKGRVRFDLDRGELQGERLVAELGRTPVELLDAVISRDTEGAFALEAKLEAQSLPLDREHLSLFLDEETLSALIDELEGRGRIDVHGGRLSVKSLSGGTNRVTFSGPITLSDLFVKLGVPLSIQSAEGRIEELVFEGGRVRGYGRLRDLYGRFADRELDRADVLITYVQPRVSIEELSGSFIDEEGRVFPLGGAPPGEEPRAGDRPGSAFSIDLEAPFPFQVAVGLRNVDVAGFTKGLFSSNVANEGRMDGELRLAGNLEELLEIRGSGYARLFDGRLWSVPVVRSVFTLLGLDDTAVFDQMSTKFEIQDGAIQMTELRARSPILRLVGSGSLDFDGSLRHDLEVNYSLIDNLGPITRLLYTIQNSLLRISIRGDMSRPKVSLRGILSGLFGFDSDGRELPLPAFSPLPKRF